MWGTYSAVMKYLLLCLDVHVTMESTSEGW